MLKQLAIALCLSASMIAFAPGAFANSCPVAKNQLSAEDMEVAKVAWQYILNNHNTETGLVNAVNNYPSTTMWDTGSAMAGIITAHDIGFIDRAKFDEMITQMLTTLELQPLFDGELPNKVYHTKKGTMVNYANRPSEKGIGVSALDLGRLASWLNILSCMHPQHKEQAERIINSWNYCEMIRNGQMYGMAWNETKTKPILLQEGRLGYEQYAGKIFQMLGFDQSISAVYRNKFATTENIYDIPILIDKRDAMTLGANNYVVAESYAMDAKENGINDELKPIVNNIFNVQKRRYEKTNIVTAVSEDNVDRRPYFVYNTIYTNGEAWAAISDMGEDYEELKTTSTKAALSMAYLYPDRPYSKVLKQRVWDARNPKGGWYSGVYEDHKGFNTATTANTNGVIMSLLLSKKYGALNKVCGKCKKGIKIDPKIITGVNDMKACKAARPQRMQAHAERVAKGQKILAANIAKANEIYRLEAIHEIRKLATFVASLEQKAKGGAAKEASAAVKSLKRTIWNMSMKFAAEQKALRKLMGPIDALSGKWAAGNAASSKSLQDALNGVADRLTNSKA
ncbi:MAG: DUF3131 domain-containing protein [Pseudomonadota bacterium]